MADRLLPVKLNERTKTAMATYDFVPTDYFNLERSELKEVKDKVEYNLNELGKGIKEPASQQSFIEISLKIDELFYQYSHNTNETYIQSNLS